MRSDGHLGPEVESGGHGGLAVDHGVLPVEDELAGGRDLHTGEPRHGASLNVRSEMKWNPE